MPCLRLGDPWPVFVDNFLVEVAKELRNVLMDLPQRKIAAHAASASHSELASPSE